MGLMTTIGMHKCSKAYDELFVKEVIRSYCTSGSNSKPYPEEPEIPEEPGGGENPPPIDPEIPVDPDPEIPEWEKPNWDVSINNPDFTGWQITNSYQPGEDMIEGFVIQVWDFEGEWAIVRDGSIIVNHETRKDNALGFYLVETIGSSKVYTVRFSDFPGEYRIYGRCASIHTGIEDYYDGTMTRKTVVDRYSLYASWQKFNFQNTELIVPSCMPGNITSTQEMFRKANYYFDGEPYYCIDNK